MPEKGVSETEPGAEQTQAALGICLACTVATVNENVSLFLTYAVLPLGILAAHFQRQAVSACPIHAP